MLPNNLRLLMALAILSPLLATVAFAQSSSIGTSVSSTSSSVSSSTTLTTGQSSVSSTSTSSSTTSQPTLQSTTLISNSTTLMPASTLYSSTTLPPKTLNSTSVSSSISSSSLSTSTSSATISLAPATNAQQGVNATAITGILVNYSSSLVNGTSGYWLNGTAALNPGQLNSITSQLLGMGASINHVQLNVSYGSVSQDGRLQGAGKTLYYVQYNGNDSVTEYQVNVDKKVPDLHVKVGNFTTSSSMGNMTLLQSTYTEVSINGVPHIYPKSTYSISPQLFSATDGNNTLNYTYSVYVGSQLKAQGSMQGSSVSKGFDYYNVPIGQPTKIVFDAQGNANYTSVDPTIYLFYTTANTNYNPPNGATLTSDLICGSLTISSGNTLTTAGHSILCNNTITDSGTINTGTPGNGGASATAGTGYSSSYAGAGGGGGSAAGGNTPGGVGVTATVNTANIITWYNNGFVNYNSGGGGGGGGATGDTGGSGSYGLYMQANGISITGTINAIGGAGISGGGTGNSGGGAGGSTLATGGTGTSSGHKGETNTGGGGGGGWVLLAYGTGTAPSTSGVSYSGGSVQAGTSYPGSAGGAGSAPQAYSYGSSAPIVVLQQLRSTSFTAAVSSITGGSTQTLTAVVSNGLGPYTYNYMVYSTTGLVDNALYTNVALTTNSFSYVQQNSWGSGTFTANLVVTDNSLDTSPTNTVTNTLTYSATSSATCVPTVSNTLINFGTVKPGSFAPTANAVTVGDSGTAATYIYLYSISGTGSTGNWVYASNYFGVSNTLWNGASDGSSNLPANALTNSITTNTLLYVSPTVSNTIYFGVNVPKGQAPGTYSQGITVSLSC